MHSGKLVFAQLMELLPLHTFRRCVAKYPSRYPTLTFSHLDQFLCMAFAQLTFRESLRDIETCLRAHSSKLYHLGIRGGVAQMVQEALEEPRAPDAAGEHSDATRAPGDVVPGRRGKGVDVHGLSWSVGGGSLTPTCGAIGHLGWMARTGHRGSPDGPYSRSGLDFGGTTDM